MNEQMHGLVTGNVQHITKTLNTLTKVSPMDAAVKATAALHCLQGQPGQEQRRLALLSAGKAALEALAK
ncbi:hypothetical protein [Gallaecimonas xiamenensis]|uniref:Uncharacterized protein n=1 Tax=Gallaecimonas xiamenensis 3-C-1 TaxID=745411 RepID=K2IXQ6_9GAMM|nr:hypothetical protein [Gallaecimonas xiamenensis]EKE75211.1 hypothetical protein B3C1_08041 [Gallaecimonas xiamenensis 3-C-1]